MRLRKDVYLVLFAFAAAWATSDAQCRKDEILVGEDAHFWYCGSRSEFPEAAADLVFAMDAAAKKVNPGKSLDLATQDKNCSSFFRQVGNKVGATGQEWTRKDLQANDIARMIANDSRHWQMIAGGYEQTTRQVQELANSGAIVVAFRQASPNGHLAIASPMPLNVDVSRFPGRGPMVRDGNVHSSQGKKKPSGWGAVRASYAFQGYTSTEEAPPWYVWLPSVK